MPDCERTRVKIRTLCQLIEECRITVVDLMKVDTEGHDYEVLVGLGPRLTPATIRMLYVEMAGNNEAIASLLTGRGYRAFQSTRIFVDTLRRLHRMEDDQVVSYFTELTAGERPYNALWVGRGTPEESLLKRISDIGVRP